MSGTKRVTQRGAALVTTLVIAMALSGLCVALLTVNLSTQAARIQGSTSQRSFYAAESGLSDAFMQLTAGVTVPPSGTVARLGDAASPIALGPSSYWAEIAEAGPRSYRLESTGVDGIRQTRLELLVSESATGFFQFAAFGADGVTLDSNALIDSYDSAYGPYASQIQGGNGYAKENGHVGSNHNIVLRSNTEIHGDARPGPTGVVNDSAPNVFVSGSMAPLDEEFAMPPIDVPSIASSGSVVGTSNRVVGPGDIHFNSIVMMGGTKLTIVGPARFVADNLTMKSNSELIFDATNGPIELYGNKNFKLESNSTVTTLSDSASDVTIFLSGNNITATPKDDLMLSANSDFIGAIYAPNAEFKLASNFEIFGSIIAKRLQLSSFGTIHFDEALLYDGYDSTGEFETKLWRRLPNQ